MKHTLGSMRSTLLKQLLVLSLICLACIGAVWSTTLASNEAPAEETPGFTSEDTLKLEDIQGTEKPDGKREQDGFTVGIVTLAETLELVIEDANQNALAGAIVDILYSGEVAGSGVTGSDGRMTFTGLSKSVSFVIAVSHYEAGELSLEYDGAVSGFDDLVVLTLPGTAAPTDFFGRLLSGSGSTESRIISIALLAWSLFDIVRIIVMLTRYVHEKCRTAKQNRVRVELLDSEGNVKVYKYAKRKKTDLQEQDDYGWNSKG